MPPSASTAMIVQCPITTTVIAAARRKSTTRLRLAGVAASTRAARLRRVLVIAALPPSCPPAPLVAPEPVVAGDDAAGSGVNLPERRRAQGSTGRARRCAHECFRADGRSARLGA